MTNKDKEKIISHLKGRLKYYKHERNQTFKNGEVQSNITYWEGAAEAIGDLLLEMGINVERE